MSLLAWCPIYTQFIFHICFPICQGLPRLARDLDRRDWQASVRRQVHEALLAVARAARLRVEFEVLLVWNNTNRRNSNGPTRYFAKLSSPVVSRQLRDAFSGFFRQHNPLARPPMLTQVSVRNKVTLSTRVRLAILKQLGENYKARNVGSSYAVKGFESRPQLTIFPPTGARDARQKSMFFMEAINSLPIRFSDEQLSAIFRVVGSNFKSKLEATFVVLSDDDHDRVLQLLRASDQGRQRGRDPQPSQQPGPALSYSGVVQQAGAGMELEGGIVRALSRPPPPPPPLPRPEVESPSVQGSPRRTTTHTTARKSRKRPPSTSPSRRKSSRSRKSRRRRHRHPSTSSSSSSTSSSTSSSNES